MEKYKKLAIFLILVLLVASFAACGSKEETADSSVSEAPQSYKMVERESEIGMDAGVSEFNGAESMDADEKIIYRAAIEMETQNFSDTVNKIKAKLNQVGGYIENSNISGRGYDEGDPKYAYFTLRIPKHSFEMFQKYVEDWGNIRSVNSNNQNVTEEYIDTEARLKTLKVQEERLLNLLGKAEKIEDMMTIERELQNVRYQIENYTGSIRKIDSLVDYATLNISIYEVRDITIDPTSFSQEILETIKASFQNAKQLIKGSLFAIIYFIPYLVFIIIILLIFKKLIGTRKIDFRFRKKDK